MHPKLTIVIHASYSPFYDQFASSWKKYAEFLRKKGMAEVYLVYASGKTSGACEQFGPHELMVDVSEEGWQGGNMMKVVEAIRWLDEEEQRRPDYCLITNLTSIIRVKEYLDYLEKQPRHHFYAGHIIPGPKAFNWGITTFSQDYIHWIAQNTKTFEENNRKFCDVDFSHTMVRHAPQCTLERDLSKFHIRNEKWGTKIDPFVKAALAKTDAFWIRVHQHRNRTNDPTVHRKIIEGLIARYQ